MSTTTSTLTAMELLGARIRARRFYLQAVADFERGAATQIGVDACREVFAAAERAYEEVAPRGTAR